jgi:hypothetical protein
MEGLQSGVSVAAVCAWLCKLLCRGQVNLISLVEMITGRAITWKYFKTPSLDIQRIENISIALAHIRKCRPGFVLDVEPKDVASG